MTLENLVWVFVGDSGGGRLLRCGLAPLARCHVDELEAIRDDWEGHERGRPSLRAGRQGATGGDENHDRAEQHSRFAREVAAWLARKIGEHGLDRLVVFAPPRFLGALRKARVDRLNGNIEEHEADLTSFSAAALSRHPAIRSLVDRTG